MTTPEPVAEAGGVTQLIAATIEALSVRVSGGGRRLSQLTLTDREFDILLTTLRAPATSAPAGDGEAEKLAADIAEATGCDNPRYNVGFTAKINRTIGFWRGVVAALRRAQPPQPSGDVGLVERLRLGAGKSRDVGSHLSKYQALCDEAADALCTANSRSARLIEQAAKIIEGEVYKERYRKWPCVSLEGNHAEDSAVAKHCAKLAQAVRALSPTEPAGSGG